MRSDSYLVVIQLLQLLDLLFSAVAAIATVAIWRQIKEVARHLDNLNMQIEESRNVLHRSLESRPGSPPEPPKA